MVAEAITPPTQTFRPGPPATMGRVHTLLDLKRWIKARATGLAVQFPADKDAEAGIRAAGLEFLEGIGCDPEERGPWIPDAWEFAAMLQWCNVMEAEGAAAAVSVAVPMMTGLPDVILAWTILDMDRKGVAWMGPGMEADGVQVQVPAPPGLDFDAAGMLRHG